ncbi:phosphoribosylpyrophosphate synthetase [Croceivirga radicis]|uniref:Phosphoribosylpyrophosphate synthetase n=1 Tax=Croceivirga radicis TaxID=1929488 RepID=A0A1V6LUT4_9FLAO|nr:ribose-phosphate diphosphokinase [Croceivirga radicis]OQD43898.1 phosphoribosylpyrophosphate synthetase [Croceivirga radicis]
MNLNLDPTFGPNANQIAFEAFTFNGGEPHIKIKSDIPKNQEVVIYHRINSFNDLGLLLVATDALRHMGVKDIALFLPYLPGARQDRLMIAGEPLTVKVYTQLINAQHYSSVTLFDPHSEVGPALLDNCVAINNHAFIQRVCEQIEKDAFLISPDGGALKKIYKLAAYLQDYHVVECSKSRDVKTGQLTGFKVYADTLENKSCLVVDDICDGGGTFIGLAEKLKEKQAGKLYLAVSHGIFSKGFDTLLKHYDKIFVTNAVRDVQHPKVIQINLLDLN